MRYARVPEAVILARLTGTERRVYEALALHANRAGNAWPGQAALSRLLGMDKRQLQRALDALVTKRLVEVTRQGGYRFPNIYYLPHLDTQRGRS